MKKFVDFMSGKAGQRLRIVIGAVLITLAIALLQPTAQYIVGVLGVLLILSGVLKVCALNLFVGRPINACPNNK